MGGIYIRALVLFATALGVLFGCGDESSVPGSGAAGAGTGGSGGATETPTSIALASECAEVFPLTACLAFPADGAPLPASDGPIGATVGDVSTSAVVKSGAIVFTVPEGTSGELELAVDFGGATGYLTLQVSPGPTGDGTAATIAFESAVDAVVASFENFLESPAGSAIREQASGHLDQTAGDWAIAKQALNSLSEDERKTLGKFLLANPELLVAASDLTAALTTLSQSTALSDCRANWENIRAALRKWAKVASVGILVGLAVPPLAVAGAVIVAVASLDLLDATAGEVDCFAVELQALPMGAPVSFTSGQAKVYPLSLATRNLQPFDAQSEVGWIRDGVSTVVSAAPFLSAVTNTIRGPFVFPGPKEGAGPLGSIRGLSVTVDGNPEVTGDVGGTAAMPTLTFTTGAATTQDFTFKLSYTEADQAVTLGPMAATVSLLNCNTITTSSSVERTCLDERTGIATSEFCSFPGGVCDHWYRRTSHPGGALDEEVLVSNAGKDYDEEKRDDNGQILRHAHCRVESGMSTTAWGWEKDFIASTCRYWEFNGVAGCDTGTVPGTFCNTTGCITTDPGPTFGCGDVDASVAVSAADVTILTEGLCGMCPFAN